MKFERVRQLRHLDGRSICGNGHYQLSRPFCQDSSRSRTRNSSVIKPLHINATMISAAYMLG
jgi:hypothetical protein